MKPDHEILTAEEWDKAHALLTAWKSAPEGPLQCPRCGAEGIAVTDHSARPFAEWYDLGCGKCGLTVTMHLPLAPTPGPSV